MTGYGFHYAFQAMNVQGFLIKPNEYVFDHD
jgi:hypothetical protein